MSRIVNLQTIYAEGRTIYEENKFLLNPSSNCKVVSIKANRKRSTVMVKDTILSTTN